MSTTIITQFSQSRDESTTSITQDDVGNVIQVCNYQTHGEGKNKYTDYEIRVKSNSSIARKLNLDSSKKVRRRYNDFLLLYNELNGLRINLPKLPNKQFKVSIIPAFNKKNFEEEFIKYRCKHLEKFLNKLAENPICQSNKTFHQFLQDETFTK